jgi:hypothetical protein
VRKAAAGSMRAARRGQISGQHGHDAEQQRHASERQSIAGRDAEQHRLDRPSQNPGGEDADGKTRQRNPRPFAGDEYDDIAPLPPSATRTPISRVRCATAKATSVAIPTAS